MLDVRYFHRHYHHHHLLSWGFYFFFSSAFDLSSASVCKLVCSGSDTDKKFFYSLFKLVFFMGYFFHSIQEFFSSKSVLSWKVYKDSSLHLYFVQFTSSGGRRHDHHNTYTAFTLCHALFRTLYMCKLIILAKVLWGRCCSFHVSDEKIKAKKGQEICPG